MRAITGVLFAGFQEGTISRHEACEHRTDQLDWIGHGLARLTAERLGIGEQIAMDCGRKFDGELDRTVVGKRS